MSDSSSPNESTAQNQGAVDRGAIERFRPYLSVLAQTRFQYKLQSKLDTSDIVQQTMLNAYQSWEQFRGKTEAELAAWLRQILANIIARNLRDLGRGKRDIHRERSIDADLQQSSMQLGKLLADQAQNTPSQIVMQEERAASLAMALMELPEDQRQAILGKYWHGLSSSEIGDQLQRSPEAVAGLLYRGLKKLRQIMSQTKS